MKDYSYLSFFFLDVLVLGLDNNFKPVLFALTQIAVCLTDCRPVQERPLFLYNIKMLLMCPLPEEQNTRGRKIHPPEESPTGFGILLTKKIPKVCSSFYIALHFWLIS